VYEQESDMTSIAIEAAPSPRRTTALKGGCGAPSITLDRPTLLDAYGEHHGAAFSLAYRILGDRPSAEDAVQDAFVKLWTGSAQFDPSRGSMRGLLLTIARHTSIDVIRRRARRQRTEQAYCTDATYVTEGPERAIERAYDVQRVRTAVSALPGKQRSAIEQAYFSGCTRHEIAAAGHVPVGTAKSRVRLGMKKLALALADGS